MTDKTGPHSRTTGLVQVHDRELTEAESGEKVPGESRGELRNEGRDLLGQRLANAQAALELAGVGCWDWEVGTVHVAWTPTMEKLWGFAPGEFDGTLDAVAARITDEDLQRWRESVRATLEEGREHRIEMRLNLPDGSCRWVEALGNVVHDAGGKPVRMMGTCQDISERRRVEEKHESLQLQLAHAQKMDSIGRLAGGVAHDFNNLLQAILGHAELMQQKLPAYSPLAEHLEQILRTAQRSADLTRQLLAFASKQTVKPQLLYLNEIVGNTLAMLQRLIGEQIQVSWQPGQGLPPVHIDPVQMEQMITNVILNARDAITGHGSISIGTDVVAVPAAPDSMHPDARPGTYARLWVRDDGIGMAPDVLGRVFEPFFTTKAVGKGTGLGLAMVYGAVHQNDGFISIDSAPGAGTFVAMHLPARRIGAAVLVSEDEDSRWQARQPVTILVVEDEPAILAIADEILRHLGHRVLTASSPSDALAIWQGSRDAIELVLTDVIMPEMNGHELIERFRNTKPGLKCIFMSGYPSDIVAERGLLAPEVNFIHKPFTIRTLGSCVARLLEA